MPIVAVQTQDAPPARTRDQELAAAMADLLPHYTQALAMRDQQGSDQYVALQLSTEDEAKKYSTAFHRMAQNDNRVATVRTHGASIFCRVLPKDAPKRVRGPRSEESKAKSAEKRAEKKRQQEAQRAAEARRTARQGR